MRKIRCLLLLVLLGIPSVSIKAQATGSDWNWWIIMHAWDGYSPWRYYLTMSPGYTGPNALPVPESSEARIPEYPYARVNGYAHLSLGDQTVNPYVRFGIPFGNRVLFEAWYVPIEFYQMDSTTVFIRASLEREGKGYDKGDVYISTGIQIMRAKGWKPDLQLRTAIKTASGEKLDEARHTDAPGYFFDLTSAWDIKMKNGNIIRPFASVGFYAWQIYHPRYYQNDAVMYSGGMSFQARKHTIKPYLAGYYGWMDNGDRPLAFRLDYEYKLKNGSIMLQYQYGIHDLYFDSYGIGYKYSFTKFDTNHR